MYRVHFGEFHPGDDGNYIIEMCYITDKLLNMLDSVSFKV